jgi:hypothetical protein
MDIQAVILGLELAGEIDLGPRDMAMDVDSTGHDDHAGGIDTFCLRGDGGDYPAVLDTEIPYLTVDVIGRIVDPAIDDPEHGIMRPSAPGALPVF